jgi:hypothetical protein
MIHVFNQEKSIWGGGDKPVDIIVEGIALRIESIVSAEPLSDNRCLIGLSTGRELVVKHTFDEVHGLLIKQNS